LVAAAAEARLARPTGDPDGLAPDADVVDVDRDLVDRDVGRHQCRPRAVVAHAGDAARLGALGLGQAEVHPAPFLAREALDDADAVDAAAIEVAEAGAVDVHRTDEDRPVVGA